jgi:hypothetical protein
MSESWKQKWMGGRLAAVAMGGVALLWAAMLFLGIPLLYGKKVEALVGQPREVVEGQLGPPTRVWSANEFSCDQRFPCDPSLARGGSVSMYSDGKQAWYLYFDADEKLAQLEAVRPGVADAGTPPATTAR